MQILRAKDFIEEESLAGVLVAGSNFRGRHDDVGPCAESGTRYCWWPLGALFAGNPKKYLT
jgi:hypothetical protein